jgi:glycosyltransferase involved in cell wall biosynthesis
MKKTIVISAINIFEGGALSILQDCLKYLESDIADEYNILAFVHRKSLFDLKKVSLIELPKSRRSYLYRLYYEYIWFYSQSKKIEPYLWLSLHDITPNVKSNIRAVYCHNPSPFYRLSYKEFLIEPSLGYFNVFYKYLYLLNLNKNKYVIVQQKWLREKFIDEYNTKAQIIVANPSVSLVERSILTNTNYEKRVRFFFPAFPRVFKNFECVCEAAKLLSDKGLEFELLLTIAGNENKYAKGIFGRYSKIPVIFFLGLLSRNRMNEIYRLCDALVFPSKLETWGLPISEAKAFSKPILVSDLPYSHETVGDYDKVSFFDPSDYKQLASLMEKFILNDIVFDGNIASPTFEPYANSWEDIFKIILK